MGNDRKKSSAVDKQILGESLGANAFEDDVVGLQCLEVNPTGQCWVQALCQPLSDRHFLWDDWILQVIQQYLP